MLRGVCSRQIPRDHCPSTFVSIRPIPDIIRRPGLVASTVKSKTVTEGAEGTTCTGIMDLPLRAM